jgi:hypothetical protein
MRAGAQRIPSLASYIARDPSIPRIELAKDPAKRYRWDCLYAAMDQSGRDLTREIYEYANDSHIDTALRAIVAEMQAQDRAYTGQDAKFSAALAAITREGK